MGRINYRLNIHMNESKVVNEESQHVGFDWGDDKDGGGRQIHIFTEPNQAESSVQYWNAKVDSSFNHTVLELLRYRERNALRLHVSCQAACLEKREMLFVVDRCLCQISINLRWIRTNEEQNNFWQASQTINERPKNNSEWESERQQKWTSDQAHEIRPQCGKYGPAQKAPPLLIRFNFLQRIVDNYVSYQVDHQRETPYHPNSRNHKFKYQITFPIKVKRSLLS